MSLSKKFQFYQSRQYRKNDKPSGSTLVGCTYLFDMLRQVYSKEAVLASVVSCNIVIFAETKTHHEMSSYFIPRE